MSNQEFLLKSGKYEFFISGVITQDKDGNLLKTQIGNIYQKLRLSVLDKDGYSRYVYDPIFNPKRLEQILRCIGSSALIERYEQGALNPEDLIGTGGTCIIALRAGRHGYEDQNVVDCYIQKEIGILIRRAETSESFNTSPNSSEPSFANEDFDDQIPF